MFINHVFYNITYVLPAYNSPLMNHTMYIITTVDCQKVLFVILLTCFEETFLSFSAVQPTGTLAPHCAGSVISKEMFNVQ